MKICINLRPDRKKWNMKTKFLLVRLWGSHYTFCQKKYVNTSGTKSRQVVVVKNFTKFAQAFPTEKKSVRAADKRLFEKYYLDFCFSNHILHDQTKTKSTINLTGDHWHQSLLSKSLPYYEIMVFVKE